MNKEAREELNMYGAHVRACFEGAYYRSGR